MTDDEYQPIDLNTDDRLSWWLDSRGGPREVEVVVLAEDLPHLRRVLALTGLTLASVTDDSSLVVVPAR